MRLPFRKCAPAVSDDTGEAKVIRQEARDALDAVQAQAPAVARLTRALHRRRERNHFGEEIEVTFCPRRNGRE